MFFQKFSLSMQAFGVYILFSPLLYVNGLIFHPAPLQFAGVSVLICLWDLPYLSI